MIEYKDLRPRLQAVWDHAVPVDCEHMQRAFRYVPRAIAFDGQWNVFDRKQQRFLYPYEIVAIPLDVIHTEKHYDA